MPSGGTDGHPSGIHATEREHHVVDDSITTLTEPPGPSFPRRYRALLPWPPPLLHTRTRLKIPDLNRCGIPLCKRVSCKLLSHKHYSKALRKSRNAALQQRDLILGIATLQTKSRQTSTDTTINSSPAPDFQFGDGLPDLPFEVNYPPEFRTLFQAFTHDYFYKVVIRFRQPFDIVPFRRKTIEQIAENEVFALCCLSHTKLDILMRDESCAPDQFAIQLYGRVTQSLRAKLGNLKDSDIDGLLMYVATLSSFDMLFQNNNTIQTHRAGIEQLVTARGGVHNLGWSLPYIMHVDQRLAVLVGHEPLFSSPKRAVLGLPPQTAGKYAQVFQSSVLQDVLSPEVLRFCISTGHLIELFENTEISYDDIDSNYGQRNTISYFHFCREDNGAQFACLHAKFYEDRDRDWCVLVAAKLVEYPICYGNFMPLYTQYLANNLCKILKTQDSFEVWKDCPQLLCWVLYVLSTLSITWSGQKWAITALKQHLTLRYGEEKWPDSWAGQQWKLLCNHLWSDQHLRAAFDRSCSSLQRDELS